MDKPNYPIYSYPRTPHLDFSPGATSDDKYASAETLAFLKSGIDIITTEKMDGGNLSLYRDYFHGRSLDSGTHSWDTYAKQIWSELRFDIPEGWRISCESMYARRSVAYENLESPLYVIGIWDDKNTLMSWDDTIIWAELLGLPTVPLLYRGTDYKKASKVWFETMDDEKSEGFVIRNSDSIVYEKFANNIAKWVRANHVRTNADWRHRDDFDVNTFNS